MGNLGARKKNSVFSRFLEHKLAVAAAILLIGMVLMAILAPFISPYDLDELTGDFGRSPSKEHLLGTDKLSRDVLSRLMYAARTSLVVGFGTMLFGTFLGTTFGLCAGFFGGRIDMFIMRIADIISIFPPMMLILVTVSVLKPGVWNIVLILGFLGCPETARLVRSRVLVVKEENYIKSAIVTGVRNTRLLFFHILPNVISPIVVNATFRVSSAIMTESALSFLGLGVQPPGTSWGNMLNDARALSTIGDKPWLWIPAGMMILLCVMSINFVGDGLQYATRPASD